MTILIKIIKNIGSKCECGREAKYRYFQSETYFCEYCYQTRCHKCRSTEKLEIRESNDLLCDTCYHNIINHKYSNPGKLIPVFYNNCIICNREFEKPSIKSMCSNCFRKRNKQRRLYLNSIQHIKPVLSTKKQEDDLYLSIFNIRRNPSEIED